MYASAQKSADQRAILGFVTRGEQPMIDSAGIWIDHRKAFVVTLSEDGEDTKLILSKVEKHAERGGDSPLKGRYEAHDVPADDRQQRALTGELNVYYDRVISTVRGYANVFLFGPGEAKNELHKRVVQMKVGDSVTAMEAADKMTDREIIAKVREYFGVGAARAQPKQPTA
jgi:hypothetical protein